MEGERPSGSDLAGPLAEAIRKHLQIAPPPLAADATLESKRFLAEAVRRWSFQQEEHAFEAAEAALALDPDNFDAKLQRIEFYSQFTTDRVNKAMQTAKRVFQGRMQFMLVPEETVETLLSGEYRSLELHLEALAETAKLPVQAVEAKVISALRSSARG